MLNISKNSIQNKFDFKQFKSIENTSENRIKSKKKLFFFIFIILIIALLISPWTQNIQATGTITSLDPATRPQTIHSVIPGRIERWLVAEGQFVQKNDTVAILSEIKENYFNPDLIDNIEKQIGTKEAGLSSYKEKVNALDQQLGALERNRKLKKEALANKIEQAQLKIVTDSIDLIAYEKNLQISTNQLERTKELYKEGLKSLTDLESKNLKYQKDLAQKIAQENKLLLSKNELLNANIEFNNIDNEFNDKIAKTESDKYSAISTIYDTENQLVKLENDFVNYSIRAEKYFILAPQDGYITKVFITGLGQNIKEGEALMSILPAQTNLAVELYVKPLDLPLLSVGNKVRLQFDGWPALMFSGWQGVSFGTFGGEIVAIDNFSNNVNQYRILVSPDPQSEPWPEAIRIGSGALGIVMLKNVPIYYELWRQINGFPPEYYTNSVEKKKEEPFLKKIK